MQEPILPDDEAEREADLFALLLLDTGPEERFDRITRAARRMFGAETVLISLVDRERQWFKSRQNLDVLETPRNISFCGHTILGDDIFVVENALNDARFADNPLVAGPPHIRFYAGAPLRGSNGYKIGTLCLIDSRPRAFPEQDRASLRDLAAWAESEVNSRIMDEATRMARADAEDIHQQMMLLEAVMESSDALIFVRDLDGRFLFSNDAYVRLFDRGGENFAGRHMSEIFPPTLVAEFRQRDLEVAASGISRREENFTEPGSGIRPHLVVRSPLRNQRGEVYGVCGVGTDLSQAKLIEAVMQEMNCKLAATTVFQQAVLNSANFSIISTDVDGVIRLFNVGAERMLGFSAAEVVGRKTLAILHDLGEIRARASALAVELGKPVEAGFEALVAKARISIADEHEWTYTRRDNSRFPAMVSMTALRDEQLGVTGFLAIAYDITERKQVESMKSEFISTVSHELRTPLTSIRGSLGLLTGGAVGVFPERARGLLDIAKNNCERLVRLINDILDIEKVESGNMRFEMRSQQLLPLVEQAIRDTQSYADEHQVRLVLRSADADAMVTIDADRIMQVILNLLSNAAKFSPAGSEVEVSLIPLASGIRLSVRDQGKGIAAEFRSRIFQKFSQGDSSDTRQKGGTGLGLSISKAIIDKHYGRIDFNSTPGQGSEFYFDLPQTTGLQSAVPSAGRILVCEDDSFIARSLCLTLAKGGFASDIASDAAEARILLANGHYDAMTLDLVLPGESGISLLNWIRSQEKYCALPVVVVSTSVEQANDHLAGATIGVIDWIEKPIDQARLLAALHHSARRDNGELPAVLYVEDDMDLAKVIRLTLELSFSVTHVATLAEARQALLRYRFGLILLDLHLPDGSGANLLADLPPQNAATPVVIFSAQESTQFAINNVHATLVKSRTSNEELLTTLQALIAHAAPANPCEDLK